MPPNSQNALQPYRSGWAGLPTPCPLCHRVFDCPFDEQYRRECLDFWPLGRVPRRQLEAAPGEEHFRTEALSIPWVRPILEKWQAGGQVTDEEYLRLRAAAFRLGTQKVESVYLYVLRQLLRVGLTRHTEDAIFYYGLQPRLPAWGSLSAIVPSAVDIALFIARDELVDLDASAPVISHFERVVYEVFRILFYAFIGVRSLTMPEDNEAFLDRFETEWARAMSYGNGYYGLTVIPLLSIEDMVRYQQLGGRRRAVSRSMVEYLIVQMDVFPLVVQLVAPRFREVALKKRLVAMFDPLAGSCASDAEWRLKYAGEEETPSEPQLLKEEMSAVVSAAIDEYRFMHGKGGGVPDAVGMLGINASYDLRRWIELVLGELGLPIEVSQLVHVNAARYIGARLRAHLREYYPVRKMSTVSLNQPVTEDGSTLGDLVADSGEDAADKSATHHVSVAYTVEGVQYLYIEAMAGHVHVSEDRLRHWDQEGTLKALRVRDILPDIGGKIEANRRVYPYTRKMVETIKALASRKKQRASHLKEGEFTRAEAAAFLHVSYRTLQRMEDRGEARPIRPDGKPIYTQEEIHHLAALIGEEAKGD